MNDVPSEILTYACYRCLQGSTIIRAPVVVKKQRENGAIVERECIQPTVMYIDIIRDSFWEEHPEVLK